MNLIEKLGLEKCKQIVDGAPEGYRGFNLLLQEYVRSVWFSQDVSIADFKAQIDHHYYGQSEEKELEQYALLSQEKIEGGAMLVGDFKNNLTSSEYKNYFQAKRMRTVVNAGTAVTNHIATANKDITDHCSDIKNHISPNTKVIEHE